jgi:hypothetical protein
VTKRPSVFAGLAPDAAPCPVCLRLAQRGEIQARAVMPLPPFPARSKRTNEPICRDCAATETAMALWHIHPEFGPARLCVANERCESLVMPPGMAELFGMCREGVVAPASLADLDRHIRWGERNGIPNWACAEPFGEGDGE